MLGPEYDTLLGGRLRRCQHLEDNAIHSVALHPSPMVTKLPKRSGVLNLSTPR